jgi:hypothetical protein
MPRRGSRWGGFTGFTLGGGEGLGANRTAPLNWLVRAWKSSRAESWPKMHIDYDLWQLEQAAARNVTRGPVPV